MSQSVADSAPRRRRWRAALASVLWFALPLALLAAALPAEGQEAPVVEAPAAAGEELAAEIAERFEVLPTREGLLLRPREEADYRAVEIEDGEVAVDGETVEGEALDERLGAAAGPVRRLAALGEGARVLFGYGGAPPERAGDLDVELPEPPEAPEAPETGEVPEAPEAPEPPRPPRRVEAGQRVAIASSVTVDEGEVAEVAVAIGGNVRVDGEVDQDAVAVGGSVRVDGRVGGEVVAVGGSVHLGPDADVDGDVTSVGGRVERAEGARVGGRVSEVAMTGAFFGREGRHGWWGWEHAVSNRMERIGDVFGLVFCLIVLILFVGLVTVVARAPVERVAAKSAEDPWRALLAGLLILVLFGPAMVILVISVIGCLVIPVVVALLLVGLLLGITGVGVTAGRWLEGRFGWQRKGLFVSALIGVTAIHVWILLACGLDAVSGWLWVPSAILWVFGLALFFVAWTIGLGAVWLTRFGAGPAASPAALPPPPPPGGYAEPRTPAPPAPPPVRSDSIFTEAEPEPVEPEPPAPPPAEAEPPGEPAHEPDETERREETDRG